MDKDSSGRKLWLELRHTFLFPLSKYTLLGNKQYRSSRDRKKHVVFDRLEIYRNDNCPRSFVSDRGRKKFVRNICLYIFRKSEEVIKRFILLVSISSISYRCVSAVSLFYIKSMSFL